MAIDFDGTVQHFTSHDDIANVPGTPIEGVLQGVSATSQTLNPDRANSTIGALSFSLVDVGEAFTDLVRNELLNNAVGLRGRTVSMFVGYRDLQNTGAFTTSGSSSDVTPDFDEFVLFQTQVIKDVTTREGTYKINCADIQRETKKQIFEKALTYLTASIDETATTIPVLDVSGFEGNVHGTSYTDAPSQDVIYIRIDKTKEIIRCPTADVVGNSFTNVTRGALGTKAEPIEVDLTAASDRRPKVEEYIYLELPAVKLAYAILTGDLEGTSDTLPSGWHAGVDPSFVRLTDFTGIGTDLWDTTDDDAAIVMRFENPSKQDAKRFIETEIYLLLGLFSPVYADGQLGLKRMLPALSNSPYSSELNDTNCLPSGPLRHDMQSVQNNIRVDWNYNGDRFLRSTIIVDAASISKHGQAKEKRLQFEGLAGSRFTEQVLRQLLTSLRDMYTGPPLRLDASCFHLFNQVEVGDAIRVNLTNLRDYTEAGAGLSRTMVVHGMTVDWLKGVKFKLFGSSERADEIPPVTATTCLPDAFYSSEGASLSTIPGLMSGNATNAGTFTLTGTADMNAAGSIFYWDNDLTISSGTTINIEGNVQLRVRGFLTINGEINGEGEGHTTPSGNNLYDPGQHYYWGADNQNELGVQGFIGNSLSGYGLLFRYPDDGGIPNWVWVTAAYQQTGLYDAFPNLVLNVVDTGNGAINGIPTDMRGGSGTYGPRAGEKTGLNGRSYQRATGGDPGDGGAGLCIVCRGGDFGVSGEINLSGTDGVSPTTFYNEQGGDYDIYGGPGGAGCPGALLWLLDGSSQTFPDIAGKFTALTGEVVHDHALPYLTDTPGGSQNRSLSGDWGGPPVEPAPPGRAQAPVFPWAISGYDQSAINFRIQYLPCDITPEPDQDEDVPPPTNLTATEFTGGVEVDWDNPAQAAFDHIEVWVANQNSRAAASLLTTTKNSRYIENAANIQRNRYYWVRAVDEDGNTSTFEPDTTTTTAVAYPQIQTPPAVIDPFIRLGAQNWTFNATTVSAVAEYAIGAGTDGTDALRLQSGPILESPTTASASQVDRRGPDEWDVEAFPGMTVEARVRNQVEGSVSNNPFGPKLDLRIVTSKEDGTNSRSYNMSGGKYYNETSEGGGVWFDSIYTTVLDNEPDDDEPRYLSFFFITPNSGVFTYSWLVDFVDITVNPGVFADDSLDSSVGVGLVPPIIDSRSGRVLNDQGGWSTKPGGMAQPAFQFDNTTTSGDPGAGNFRFNNSTLASVTNIYVSADDLDGFDCDTVFGFLANGDAIYIDVADAIKNRSVLFSVNGTPTDNTGWWTIPVTVQQSDTIPGNDQAASWNIQFVAQSGAAGVTSFNGRSGAVVPLQGDYDSFFLTPAEGDAAYIQIGGAVTTFEGRSGAVVATAGDYADVAETFTAVQTFAANPVIENSTPRLYVRDDNATADEGNWVISGANDAFTIGSASDASPTSIVENFITVARAGTAIGTVTCLGDVWHFDRNENAATTIRVGETSTLRGDSQDGRIEWFGEQTGVIRQFTAANSGSNMQFQLNDTGLNVQWSAQEAWSFQLRSGCSVQIYDSDASHMWRQRHDGTNVIVDHPTGAAGEIRIEDFTGLRLRDGGELFINTDDNLGTSFRVNPGATTAASVTIDTNLRFDFLDDVRITGSVSATGAAPNTGINETIGFIDVNGGVSRFGSYNWSLTAWQPASFQGSTADLVAFDGDATVNATGEVILQTDSVNRIEIDNTVTTVLTTLNVSETGGSPLQLTNGPWSGAADRYVHLQSNTDVDNIEFSLAVFEGTNNRRARFFLSDEVNEFGLHASASTGVPNLAFYVGSGRIFRYDDGTDEYELYTGGSDATFNMGRNATERVRIVVQDGNGTFIYQQDETDATSHVFTFRIDSSNTGARHFEFQEDIQLPANSIIIGDINETETLIIDGNGTLQIGTSNRSNGFAHIYMEPMGSGPGSPSTGQMWATSAGVFYRTSTGTSDLTAGADITADENVTGAWNFQAQVDFDGNGEVIRLINTANDSNGTHWINWENNIGTNFGRIGKFTSGGAYMTVDSEGDLDLIAGGLQNATVTISARQGALGGDIRLQPNSLGNGVRIEHESSGDEWRIEPDGTNIVCTTAGGAEVQFDHLLNMLDNQIERAELIDYSLEDQSPTIAASTTINYQLGQSVLLALSSTNITTLTISNWPASGKTGVLEILVTQGATPRTIAWPAAVNWPGGTAPDLATANGRFLIYLRTRDGGTNIDGTYTEALS